MKSSKLGLILTALLFISLYSDLKAQNNYLTFKSIEDMPYISEWPATVTDGKRIFAINGFTPQFDSYSQDVLVLDPDKSNNWTVFNSDAGQKAQSSAAYVPANNHIYVFGGYFFNPHRIFNGVQSIDVNTHELKTLNVKNPVATISGWAAEWKGLIYIFGGTQLNNLTTNKLFSFNPETNEFKQLANMSERLQTAGTIVNGILYTFGGFNSSYKEQSANISAYNIETNKWEIVAKLPQTVSANSVAAYGDLIFVAGDYNKENFLGYFDTKTKRFTELRSNLTGHRAGGVAVVGDLLYVFGGKTDPGASTGGFKTVQVANLSDFKSADPVKKTIPQIKSKNAKPAAKVQ